MNELLAETVESYNNYLIKIPRGCQTVADLLRADQIRNAMQIVADFSDGVIWLTTANDMFQKNGFKSELDSKKIHEFLNEVNNGLEIQDYVLVADMFEYEIKPFFEKYSAIELAN